MSNSESIALLATYAVSMAYYAFGLYLAIGNIARYIFGEKRYKEGGSFLALFYVFALGVMLPRVAQVSCQVFLNQTTYFPITYYISLIVGINLNAVILVVGFMLLDLRAMITTLNITEVHKNRTFRFWLAVSVIAVTDIPIFVCYFLPGFTVKQTDFLRPTMYGYLVYYIVTVQLLFFILLTTSTYSLFKKLRQLESTQANICFKEEKSDVLNTVVWFDIIYALRIALGFTMIPWIYSGQLFNGDAFKNLEFSIV